MSNILTPDMDISTASEKPIIQLGSARKKSGPGREK